MVYGFIVSSFGLSACRVQGKSTQKLNLWQESSQNATLRLLASCFFFKYNNIYTMTVS